MITASNSSVKRSGLPNQSLDVPLHTIACSELARVTTRDLCRRRRHFGGQDYKNVISASCWRLLPKTKLLASVHWALAPSPVGHWATDWGTRSEPPRSLVCERCV